MFKPTLADAIFAFHGRFRHGGSYFAAQNTADAITISIGVWALLRFAIQISRDEKLKRFEGV